MIVVKPLLYGQESGTVRLELPADWAGPARCDDERHRRGMIVEIDAHNTLTLLGVVLTAIRMAGTREELVTAGMLCRATLGPGGR